MIDDLIEAYETYQALSREAEDVGLRVRPSDFQQPDVMRRAWEALTSDVPIRKTYPNGDRADPPYTPRQVLTLTDGWTTTITHNEAEFIEARDKIRQQLGRRPTRNCIAHTKAGSPCRNFALPYVAARLCYNHADQWEIKVNKRTQAREQELLNEALTKIAQRRLSDGTGKP